MKTILYKQIVDEVAKASIEANYYINEDIKSSIESSLLEEETVIAKEVLGDLLKNFSLAREKQMPICQDTGIAVVFVELGQEVYIEGGLIYDAINEGVRKGFSKGYLRKSVVKSPLERTNTGDNTPAIIHLELVSGEQLKITVAPKGGGSENCSSLVMLPPAAGSEGIEDFVVNVVKKAGPNSCPPMVVGVGIGGNFEKAALLSKKALLREIGISSKDKMVEELEKNILAKINKLNIGPEGFGGKTTALAVNIETYPCHIASLPVAVNINCHVARHKTITI